jgi:hypothetical protein
LCLRALGRSHSESYRGQKKSRSQTGFQVRLSLEDPHLKLVSQQPQIVIYISNLNEPANSNCDLVVLR